MVNFGFAPLANNCLEPVRMKSARPSILFLFNHDAAHQAAHIAGIMAQLALHHPGIRVIAACGTSEIEDFIRSLLPPKAAEVVEWQALPVPPAINAALSPLNRIAPVKRLARLRYNQELFASVDIVVSTERTCLRVKRKLGSRAPKFAYVPHGSGDRNVAYHPELKQFDIMLLSGQKLIDEMEAHGIAQPEQCHLIGYPKFDTIDRRATRRFFDNDNPVFLYNPHFDPLLSSYYDNGIAILDYFAKQADRFNLIFAPHVMLFRKAIHISPEYRTVRRRPDIPERFLGCANIRIDTNSPLLFDMSYTLAADAYIGDMSSQVYEFLIRRRPCFFIDTHSEKLGGSAHNQSSQPVLPYAFWGNGAVVKTAHELFKLLPDWQAIGAQYRSAQDALFTYTIDDDPAAASTRRGADALALYLGDIR
jgi:hypothetical protein